MSTQSQRGRRVARKSGNTSVRNLYLIGGGVVLFVIAILVGVVIAGNRPAAVAESYPFQTGRTAEGFYYKGNPDAPVKVIDYSDYQCPACKAYVDRLSPIVTRDYIETGKVQFIYHEFPLQIHPNAVPAGEAARCAGDQGRYWQMHDTLFARQAEWSNLSSPVARFNAYARDIGLDAGQFASCMSQAIHTAEIAAAGQAAINANIPATPTFVVNGQQVDSAGLIPAIDAALRASGN